MNKLISKEKIIDSKIVELSDNHYLVYLKEVAVKANIEGKQETTIKAFVKRVRKINEKIK